MGVEGILGDGLAQSPGTSPWILVHMTVLIPEQSPPTIPRLSPSREMCHSFVRTVVESYLKRREWGLLPETRTDVKRIMDIIR